MAILKHPNWTFPSDEIVMLYWLTSPYRVGLSKYNMEVIFKRQNGELKNQIVPWENIPGYKIGEYYRNGKLINKRPEGEVTTITIKNPSKGEICDAITIPKYVYELQNKYNWTEKCIKYKLDNDKILFIPCIEIIRTLFTPMSYLATAILNPQRLESFIDDYKDNGKGILYLELNNALPKTAIKSIQHLIWLLFNNKAKIQWDSICYNYFNEEFIKGTNNNIKISVDIPDNGDFTFRARVKKVKNYIIVLEIKEILNLDFPYDEIQILHNNSELNDNTSNKTKTFGKRSSYKRDKDYEFDVNGVPGLSTSNKLTLNNNPTILKFKRKIKVSQLINVKKGINYNFNKGEETKEGNTIVNLISTRESEAGGKLRSSEHKPVVVENDNDNIFENLKIVLEQITYLDKEISHKLEIGDIPPYGKYSKILRKYALITLNKNGNVPLFILEIGRPLKYQLSTLFYWPKEKSLSNSQLNNILDRLLNKLLENNGHWDMKYIENSMIACFSRSTHVHNQSTTNWARRIVKKFYSIQKQNENK